MVHADEGSKYRGIRDDEDGAVPAAVKQGCCLLEICVDKRGLFPSAEHQNDAERW